MRAILFNLLISLKLNANKCQKNNQRADMIK